MFKKLLLGLGIAGFLWLWSVALVNAQWNVAFETATDFWAGNAWWLAVAGWTQDQWGNLIAVIKKWINRVLGLLSLISLIVLLFGWFKMVTAAGDEAKYKEGFKVLKQAGVWLAVIWLSRFIVTIIFWLITSTTSA